MCSTMTLQSAEDIHQWRQIRAEQESLELDQAKVSVIYLLDNSVKFSVHEKAWYSTAIAAIAGFAWGGNGRCIILLIGECTVGKN